MLRGAAQRSLKLQPTKFPRRFSSIESQSMKVPLEPSGGGGAGRKLFWFLTGTTLGTGGALVYASKDEKARELIETNVPNAKPLIDGAGQFSSVLQEYYQKISSSTTKSETATPLPGLSKELPSPASITPAEETIKSEKEVAKAIEPAPKKTEVAPAPAPAPPATPAKETPPSPAPVPSKKSHDAALTAAVNEINSAISDSREFIDAVCAEALSQNGNNSSAKDEARKKRIAQAEALVQKLRTELSHDLADEKVINKDHILDIQHKLDTAVRNLNLSSLEAEAFKIYAANYADNLKKELSEHKIDAPEDVFLPLDNVNDKKLSSKELNQFIAFGYRKLKSLQDELAKHDAAGKASMKAVLEGQRGEVAKILSQQFEADLSAKEREWKTAKELEMLQLEQKLHDIHNDQLARQAAAHSQHLQDVLETQERNLRAKFESSVMELLALERSKQQHELAILIARVSAIRKILSDRAEIDRLSSKSHQLWIATQALHAELFSGDATKESIKVRPMLNSINASFGEDAFVKTLVSQFGENNETPSQASLAERFAKVRRVCRRVATVPDPPTFTAYLWSYLRSAFVLDPPALPIRVDSDGSKYIETAEPDTLTILTTAQQLLDNNELDLCVRLMNQLSGEARNVARDWLVDARRLLELRQAANGLLAFAAANSAVGFLTYQGQN